MYLDKKNFNYIEADNFTKQFNYLFNKLNSLQDLHDKEKIIWTKKTRSRKNKSIYFKSKKLFFNSKEIKFIKFLEVHTKKFAKYHGYKINNLERIQIIESTFIKNKNGQENYIYNFHIDKLNSFKAIFFIVDINNKNGPLQLASNLTKKNRESICKILDDKKKFFKKKNSKKNINFRDLKTDINFKKYLSLVGKKNSIFIINGDWPHRAGLISKNHKRKLIIFEWFTIEDSKIYKNDLKKYNDF